MEDYELQDDRYDEPKRKDSWEYADYLYERMKDRKLEEQFNRIFKETGNEPLHETK